MDDPATMAARFPAVAVADGHYESFYLKACHPVDPVAVWIRYTVHKAPESQPTGSVWFTLFDAAADGPRAVKATLAGPETGEGRHVEIGDEHLLARRSPGERSRGWA